MYNIVAIMGEAGSGKDRLIKEILSKDTSLHKIIHFTSRPRRENEINNIDYYFYTDKQCQKKLLDNSCLEYALFNNWFYGTDTGALKEDSINIGTFSPEAIRQLLKRKDCSVLVIWVRAADKTRLMRQLTREIDPNVTEIVRRFQSDAIDFQNIKFNYIPICNEDFKDLASAPREILKHIKQHFN